MNNDKLILKMIEYYRGDPKRIQHFLKVYEFSSLIGRMENLPANTLNILETAAILHDIGIKNSELKYNSTMGKYQELEGPPEAKKMLNELGYEDNIIERVCYLIAHHHTYSNIDGIDYQILVEADFLVNLYEDMVSKSAVLSAREKIFKTKSGIELINSIYDI